MASAAQIECAVALAGEARPRDVVASRTEPPRRDPNSPRRLTAPPGTLTFRPERRRRETASVRLVFRGIFDHAAAAVAPDRPDGEHSELGHLCRRELASGHHATSSW